MFNDLARFARNRMKARAARRTEFLLDSLPVDIQKDIGWKWSPRLRGKHID
jgi:hypothetical protein